MSYTLEQLEERLERFAENYQQAENRFQQAQNDLAQLRDEAIIARGAYLAIQQMVNELKEPVEPDINNTE